jgi:hypothetical protein
MKQEFSDVFSLTAGKDSIINDCVSKPFEGALTGTPLGNYHDPDKDKLRQQINAWIRTSGDFDAVIDFDVLTRDPRHPARFKPEFDSGDHLHPGYRGNRAMADTINLVALFQAD